MKSRLEVEPKVSAVRINNPARRAAIAGTGALALAALMGVCAASRSSLAAASARRSMVRGMAGGVGTK